MRNNEFSAGERGRGGARGEGGGEGREDVHRSTKRDRGCSNSRSSSRGEMCGGRLSVPRTSPTRAPPLKTTGRGLLLQPSISRARGGEVGRKSLSCTFLHHYATSVWKPPLDVSRRSAFVRDGASSPRERREEIFLSAPYFCFPLSGCCPFMKAAEHRGKGCVWFPA